MNLRIKPAAAVVILTGLAILATALSLSLMLWSLRNRDLAHARGETVSLSSILSEQTTRSLQNVDLVLLNARAAVAAHLERGESLKQYAVHAMLRDRLSGMPQIKGIFIVDASGRVASTSRTFPVEDISVADREYFVAHRAKAEYGLYIGAPTHNRLDGQWTMYVSRGLAGRRGEFAGVIAVALELGYFESLYHSIAFDGIEPIMLYLNDGTLVARAPQDEGAIGKRVDHAAEWVGRTRELTRQERDAEGRPRIVTYRPVSDFPLVVGVAIGEANALEAWRDKASLMIPGALGLMVFLALAGWALLRQLGRQETLARELTESGERLRETMHAAMDAIVIVDADQRVVLFNPAAERVFGCAADQAIGTRIDRFLPERVRAAHYRFMADFGESADGARLMAAHRDAAGLRADGTEFPIEATISRVKMQGETLYTVILRDITERRDAERRLVETNRQLRALSATLQDVREEERTRIARELHDELGQQLTGLKMELSWLARQVGGKPDAIGAKIDAMKRQLDMTVKSVRRISTDLRPALLDDLGLCAAIEWLASDFSGRTGIATEVDFSEELCDQGDALATALFRITQECLTNVARHAEATRVRIGMRAEDGNLVLSVSDDGKGMASAEPGRAHGHGLIGIRERAIMLGAHATFISNPGKGTTIEISVPLKQAEASTELET